MRFGSIPLEEAKGAILAHSIKAEGLVLKKGRRLAEEDLEALRRQGLASVAAVVLEEGDVAEDEAAARLAAPAAGDGVTVGRAVTGRANLHAAVRGLLVLDEERIHRLNAVDESVTFATLPAFAVVEAKQMVATVKIIPFAAPEAAVRACLRVLEEGPLVRVAPFRRWRARLVQTELPGMSPKLFEKTLRVTRERVEAVGGGLLGEARCPHTAEGVRAAVRDALREGFDMLLIAGASAITDRRDVLPAGVEAAGGRVEHFGMPVDPGNLLLLARLGDRPVLGLPGCCRSPRINGFDWVLQRLAAGLEVTPRDITRMGVGGLLTEIPSRPQPRDAASAPAAPPKVGALVLAAGQSRRMGGPNKLLLEVEGKPMVRHVVEAALASSARPVVVVTGHQADAVEAALAGCAVRFARNPDHAAGLSTSLKMGIAALGEEVDGAIVCLGDMPRLTARDLDRLIAAFDPLEGRSIVVPTWRGKRGNPVVWGRAHFPEFRALEGDVGARHLIGLHAEAVVEVAMDDAASQIDVDTPEALAALTGAPA